MSKPPGYFTSIPEIKGRHNMNKPPGYFTHTTDKMRNIV